MSIRITRRSSRALPLVAAALFVQIGSATAASPQGDIQEQMRELLSGSIATHAITHSQADPATVLRSNSDAQQFAQQLLLGWSASHLGRAQAAKPEPQAEASESSQKPQTGEDFQSTVRRLLLGERATSRAAL